MNLQGPILSLILLCAPACASRGATSAVLTRSPTLDYPPPPAETSDGRVVGADGISPERARSLGPQLGSVGLLPASPRPSVEERSVEPEKKTEDPLCAMLGMKDEIRKARCDWGVETMQAP